jgi:hypothetical protein
MRFNQIMEPLVSLMNNIDHISSLRSVIIDHYQAKKIKNLIHLNQKCFKLFIQTSCKMELKISISDIAQYCK